MTPSNEAQMRSKSYELPEADVDFLLRAELRGVRFLLEYQKAEMTLREQGVRSTIVAFGSARTPSPEQAASLAASATDAPSRVRAAQAARRSRRYEMAREFGRIASLRGGALTPSDGVRDNVVATGGGGGIMEAACRGAHEAGAPAIGFNITLPHEQQPNPYTTPELTFQFHYFGMRKMHLALHANALVIFPGGLGTFDEAFEMLTLRQTGVMERPVPIVFVDRGYWSRAVDFRLLVEEGMITEAELALFDVVDDAEEAWAALLRRGLRLPPPRG